MVLTFRGWIRLSVDYNLKRVASCTVLLQGKSQAALDEATHQVHEVIEEVRCFLMQVSCRKDISRHSLQNLVNEHRVQYFVCGV